VALGQAQYSVKEIAGMNRGIVVKITRVYMKPGVYPSVWKKRGA